MILHTFDSLFENYSLTPEQLAFLDRYVEGTWKINPSTGLVDVDGEVSFSYFGYNSPPDRLSNIPVGFGNVTGSFYCSDNLLTSLENSPKEVGGTFRCVNNSLTSLREAPQKVGGNFNCSDNKLTSLEGAPQNVKGDFDCSKNKLTSLAGAPQEVGGDFISKFVNIPKGKWGFEGWLNVLEKGDEKEKSLILTILSPLYINKKIEKNPEEMMMRLKDVWNSPGFASTRKEIVIPDRYKQEMGTLADLSDLGF